jgi:hypothetical protein
VGIAVGIAHHRPGIEGQCPPCEIFAQTEERTMKAIEEKSATKKRFEKFARTWKSETELFSKVSKHVLHPAYQKIIGMGEAAIPLILEDLSQYGPDDWFWALTAISDENPITNEIAGDMVAMTEAWLQWGRKRGYLDDCQNRPNELSQT